MLTNSPQLEALLAQVDTLSTLEKVQLAEATMAKVEQELKDSAYKLPRKSLLGVLAKYGSAPSEDEIDEARREMWGNFPREDI
jgi:hypothetical protein